jgi:hypothetical protein
VCGVRDFGPLVPGREAAFVELFDHGKGTRAEQKAKRGIVRINHLQDRGVGLPAFGEGAGLMEPFRGGLLTSKEARGNAGFPDSHLRPVWTEEQRAACAEERLTHETDWAALRIAQGPFEFPMGHVQWTLRADDRTRADTLNLSPLPSRSIRELLRTGIINTTGVIIEAWKAEVQRLRL